MLGTEQRKRGGEGGAKHQAQRLPVSQQKTPTTGNISVMHKQARCLTTKLLLC